MKTDGPAVGIIANPAAGRDIRRLVAQASVFPISEKRNMITRIFSALSAAGVRTCYLIPDESGIADRVRQALRRPPPEGQTWPRVAFLDMPIDESPVDTLTGAARMAALGAGAILVLGGDGTNRLVAGVCGDVPLAALSTGTNNVFPAVREATIAGLAAGLVATGAVPRAEGTRRNKVMRISVNGVERDLALVDVCIAGGNWVGAKALWRADALDQLFVSFAEADAIGLSSIAGLLRTASRDDAHGIGVDIARDGDEAGTVVAVPLAPGLIVEVGVTRVFDIAPGEEHVIRAASGMVALDGEREIVFAPGDRVSVRLEANGPFTIDVPAVMAYASRNRLLVR